jgi:hypothetical protein
LQSTTSSHCSTWHTSLLTQFDLLTQLNHHDAPPVPGQHSQHASQHVSVSLTQSSLLIIDAAALLPRASSCSRRSPGYSKCVCASDILAACTFAQTLPSLRRTARLYGSASVVDTTAAPAQLAEEAAQKQMACKRRLPDRASRPELSGVGLSRSGVQALARLEHCRHLTQSNNCIGPAMP